jgi:hypothetical protein
LITRTCAAWRALSFDPSGSSAAEEDGGLVFEQIREQRACAGQVARGDDHGVGVLGAELLDVGCEVGRAPGGDQRRPGAGVDDDPRVGTLRDDGIIGAGGDERRAAARRLQIAVKVVEREYLHLDLLRDSARVARCIFAAALAGAERRESAERDDARGERVPSSIVHLLLRKHATARAVPMERRWLP